MTADDHQRTSAAHDAQHHVAVHSLGWLVFANAVGILLACLLMWPSLGDLLAPWSYGRWITLHLNLQLYGWCSLPLVGLLFRMYLPDGPGRMPGWAVQLWSGALIFAAVEWLAGRTTGKPFMEWSGASRWVMPASMMFLALTLAAGYMRRARGASAMVRTAKTGLLLLLAAVPAILAWASSPGLYPPINPDSGGATGGSLLGSTLGVVGIIMACPLVAGLPRRRGWTVPASWAALGVHFAWFSLLDHGHRSHHEPGQIVALGSLVVWLPLLVLYLRRFTWPPASRRWLAALCAWGFVLLTTALFTFLPGVLDRWKFTNALVAHTHIAMGGMLTCFLVLVLIALDPRRRRHTALGDTGAFVAWHGGCGLYALTMLLLGIAEASDPGIVYFSEPLSQWAYALRLAAGILMLAASWRWLARTVQAAHVPELEQGN